VIRFSAIAKATFSSRKVVDAVQKAELRVVQRQSYAVFQEAKTILKSGGNKNVTSKPGEPPRGHVGLLKKEMRYAVDTSTRVGTIGPQKVDKPGQAPGTLEHGGDAEIPVMKWNRGKPVRTGRTRKVRIAARPFMRPSLKKSEPKLSAIWRGAVK
jgi:hypothetical protein